MKDTNPTQSQFFADVKPNQVVWGLQDKTGEDWVICDSAQFENTDVMPLWSSESLAQRHCCDEWKDYQPAAISVADFLEFWVDDLNEDGVMLGINWQGEDDCLEIDLVEFSQSLAEIEAL